jgi:hypothetical protein
MQHWISPHSIIKQYLQIIQSNTTPVLPTLTLKIVCPVDGGSFFRVLLFVKREICTKFGSHFLKGSNQLGRSGVVVWVKLKWIIGKKMTASVV